MIKLIDKIESFATKIVNYFNKISLIHPNTSKIGSKIFILIIGIFIGLMPLAIDKFIFVPQNQHREQKEAANAFIETDEKYKKVVTKELERNIRILQFYVWISKYPWTADFRLLNTINPYISFIESQNVIVQKVYSIDMFSDILRIYQKFDNANSRIEVLNSIVEPDDPQSKLQIADFLSATINDAISVHKKICDSINLQIDVQKKYLTDEWSDKTLLENNCREFMIIEHRSSVTAEQVTNR